MHECLEFSPVGYNELETTDSHPGVPPVLHVFSSALTPSPTKGVIK